MRLVERSAAGRTPSRGSYVGTSAGTSAGECQSETSTQPRVSASGGPERAAALRGCRAWTSTTSGWLLDRDGQDAAPTQAGRVGAGRRCKRARAPARRRTPPSTGRGGADPGRPAHAGPRPSSATWPRGCTSPATASSRPPGCRSPTTGRPGSRRPARASLVDLGCGIGGDLVAFARAGITAAGVDLDPLRVAVAQANLGAPRARRRGAGGRRDRRSTRPPSTSPSPTRPVVPARGRTFDADAWTPPWSFVEQRCSAATPA